MQFALQGQYSLDMPQKSFKIKSKAKYGEKYFSAKLFDDRPYTEYKGFVLRNSGNDCVWTRMDIVNKLSEYSNIQGVRTRNI